MKFCIPWCINVIYHSIFRGSNIVLRASEYLGQSVPDLCFSIPLPWCLHKTLCSAPIATAIVWDHISIYSKGTLFCTGLSEYTVGNFFFFFKYFKFHWQRRMKQSCWDCKQRIPCQADMACAFYLDLNLAETHWSQKQGKNQQFCSCKCISANSGVTSSFCQTEIDNEMEHQCLK